MSVALVTGASGLVGSQAVRFFADVGFDVVGIDNDLRAYFFGPSASTDWSRKVLEQTVPRYKHQALDIRDEKAIAQVFAHYSSAISLIIHAAAQPSHDWAAREPLTDWSVNAGGTLTLLEMMRKYCPNAVFIFCSTNKVYGDTPNRLPLVEMKTRFEVASTHAYAVNGIDEQMSIDQTRHSLFGASKVAADVMVQEYGRYFSLQTACFRGGCITGPAHSGAELHGFLAYLMKCAIGGDTYRIYGYKGKQVRDNIHAADLVNCFYHFFKNPRAGEVYNIGGSRKANCSVLEAIELCENVSGRKLTHSYVETNRIGDHIWWLSDVSKFKSHYPDWDLTYDLEMIAREIHDALLKR